MPRDQDRKLVLLRDISDAAATLPERGSPVPHVAELDDAANPVKRSCARCWPVARHLVTNCRSASDRTVRRCWPSCGTAAEAARPTGLRRLSPDTARQRLADFEQRLKGDLAEDLHRLRDVATPAPITLDDLPPALRERYVGRSGKWLLRVFAKDCLWDYGRWSTSPTRYRPSIRTRPASRSAPWKV